MAQYKTYDMVGIQEDVSDVISNISPKKTPFTSLIGSESVDNTLFEWQEDSLRAVQTNAQVEGFTAADATLSPTVMRSNRTQILEKTFKVSGTADRVKKYGRAKETAYQAAKAGSELKRDLEHAMVGLNQSAAAGTSTTARTMASYRAQISTSSPNNMTFTGGTGTAIDEADIKAALQDVYDAGADPTHLMVTPSNSLIVADLAAATGRVRDINNGQKDRAIVNAIDLYISQFGEVRVILNRFLKSSDTLVFDPANWKKAVLRDWFRETLAKTGDNTQQMIVGEFSLKHKNFSASAMIVQDAS
jgi:hypothetical protein